MFLSVLGCDIQCPGEPCGQGLSAQAAKDLGLLQGTSVATSILDAHAGGLGKLPILILEFFFCSHQNFFFRPAATSGAALVTSVCVCLTKHF